MTLEEYFNKERRVGKGFLGKLILFEAQTLKRIDNNKNISIVKNNQMHVTNIAVNYICWYAMNNPNTINIYCSGNSFVMRDIADYLNDMGVLEKWEQKNGANGPRIMFLHNGSNIVCYTQKSIEVNVTLRGEHYGVIVFDEIDIDISNALDMSNYHKLILIDEPSDFIYKYWIFDEENDKHLHKIALSVEQNQYRFINVIWANHRYYNDIQAINPFKQMEIEIIEKNNE